jgi:hypothetical protein
MTTLSFSKSVDDIEEPELIPEDWYVFRVSEPPSVEENKAMKAKKSYADGAGKNLVISLRLISDIQEYSGRTFKLYLPYPVEEDLNQYDGRGMLKYDAKLARIAEFAEKATGCNVEGSEITILPNAQVGLYLTQGLDQAGVNLTNSLDWFQGFMAPDEIGADTVDPEPSFGEDDLPI